MPPPAPAHAKNTVACASVLNEGASLHPHIPSKEDVGNAAKSSRRCTYPTRVPRVFQPPMCLLCFQAIGFPMRFGFSQSRLVIHLISDKSPGHYCRAISFPVFKHVAAGARTKANDAKREYCTTGYVHPERPPPFGLTSFLPGVSLPRSLFYQLPLSCRSLTLS